MPRSQRTQSLLQFGLFAGILVFINILANQAYTHLDLTEEKRYTLTKPTRELLKSIDDRIYVRVLLEGEFPAGFKRLRTATREMLDDFRSVSGYIDYQFEDPNKGSKEEVNARRKALLEEGIAPVNLNVRGEGESKSQIIYPTAVFHYGSRKVIVNLLENQSPTLLPDEVINNSISLLEYKFANAIKKLRSKGRPIILFTRGHGELDELQTKDFERSLRQFYDTDRIALDSIIHLPPDKCELLIIAQPRTAFSERDKFIVDQYIMGGGKVLWLVDRLNASLDSLRHQKRFIPSDYPLNLEDMLFKYGVRIQPDLVLDMECTQIPLQVGVVGNAPQFRLFPWPYHLAVLPTGAHPVVKNLDRVELRFCSSIDTIRTKTPVNKTVLLRSSRYSRLQFSPIEIGFEIMGEELKPEYFNKGHQTLGVLLEGEFPSNYENRVSEQMAEGLRQAGLQFRPRSQPTRMIVISDGDVAANFVRDPAKKEWLPLGFNRFENATYANRDLLINAVEYLIESSGVIEARSREVKLRLLDTVRAKEEKPLWQALNIGAPLLFLALFGIFFHWRRKRRYQ
ncbi:MAG: gliding motility-associated ABC transporter substrate-binding protein GldG [Saprospiraceae bacterium]|nr:gliding motility-associated ABC transporter substrate-binding protein GldG [Saprospiraceae bacterium]MDW8229613.1 gliding motility-associated ABC transporter substrate-binding protein GldG [Saprospiraceae bacterium]